MAEHKEARLMVQIRRNKAHGSLSSPWTYNEQLAALQCVSLLRRMVEDPQAPGQLAAFRDALLAFDTGYEPRGSVLAAPDPGGLL